MKKYIIPLMIIWATVFVADSAYARDCLDCHRDTTPGVVARWQKSAHAPKKVSCQDCHGSDVESNHDRTDKVPPERCGSCHKGAFTQWQKSGHATSNGRSAAPCEACHTSHATANVVSGLPEACARCHGNEGQYLAWRGSLHAAAYLAWGRAEGPDCVSCHMVKGSHDTSEGIASGMPADVHPGRRKVMVDTCAECHPPAIAARALDGGDAVYGRSRALESEAHEILAGLYASGSLIGAMPRMLRELEEKETISRAESLYLDVVHKGHRETQDAFHLWRAGFESERALAELKGESRQYRKYGALLRRLNEISPETQPKPLSPDELRRELDSLKGRFDAGEMTPAEYRTRRDELLDRAGL